MHFEHVDVVMLHTYMYVALRHPRIHTYIDTYIDTVNSLYWFNTSFLLLGNVKQAHVPNKDNSKYSSLDRELFTLCMAESICLYSKPWRQNYYISTAFLPVMASEHSSKTYKLELLKNRWVYNLLAMWSSARTYWQWAGPKFQSLLSAHHLIGTYFLTTESDKCITY